MKILFVFNISFDGNETSIHLLKDVVEEALKKGHDCHVILKKTDTSVPSALDSLKENYSLTLDYVYEESVKKGGFVKRYIANEWISAKGKKCLFQLLNSSHWLYPLCYNITPHKYNEYQCEMAKRDREAREKNGESA